MSTTQDYCTVSVQNEVYGLVLTIDILMNFVRSHNEQHHTSDTPWRSQTYAPVTFVCVATQTASDTRVRAALQTRGRARGGCPSVCLFGDQRSFGLMQRRRMLSSPLGILRPLGKGACAPHFRWAYANLQGRVCVARRVDAARAVGVACQVIMVAGSCGLRCV